MEKIFITYAWAIGCWKSPITNYISTKLWLPTFNTDAIRSEVLEDLLEFDEDEIQRRIKERLDSLIKEWKSFICDASVDRTRWVLKGALIKNHYRCFIISIDLDKEILSKFYDVKSYHESMKIIDNVFEDHKKFLKEFSSDINIHINAENYKNRLENVYNALNRRIKSIKIDKTDW